MANSSKKQTKTVLSEVCYNYILELLMVGKLEPGDEVNRRQIASDLGISSSPVNEAIAQLESEGLIEVLARLGTRVRLIKLDDFLDLLFMRQAIECQAARDYCGEKVRANEKQLKKLARVIKNAKRGTQQQWSAELNFHSALVGLIERRMIKYEFDKIMRQKYFFRISMLAPFEGTDQKDMHEDLIDSLMTDNPDKAEEAIRNHLEAGRQRVLKMRAS